MDDNQLRVRVRCVERFADGDRFMERVNFEERGDNAGAAFTLSTLQVFVRQPTSEPLFHAGHEFILTISKS